jgi:hypothetical protein
MIDYSERSLTALLGPVLESIMRKTIGDMVVVYELRTLQGRPDVVVFQTKFSPTEADVVHYAGIAMASYTSAAILGVLHQRSAVKFGFLSENVDASKRSIHCAVAGLTRASLIEIDGDRVSTTSLLNRLSVPLTAIEVKRNLSNRAVFQARQYCSFAARGIITVWYDGNTENFSGYGGNLASLGLIGIRTNGEACIIRRGRMRSPRNLMAYYYALGNAYTGNSVRYSGFAANLLG